jgi:hypothetical protein
VCQLWTSIDDLHVLQGDRHALSEMRTVQVQRTVQAVMRIEVKTKEMSLRIRRKVVQLSKSLRLPQDDHVR